MKIETVKYLCDLCGKEIVRDPFFGGLTGSAFMVGGFIGTRKRIDLCDKCCKFIRENGHIEKGATIEAIKAENARLRAAMKPILDCRVADFTYAERDGKMRTLAEIVRDAQRRCAGLDPDASIPAPGAPRVFPAPSTEGGGNEIG